MIIITILVAGTYGLLGGAAASSANSANYNNNYYYNYYNNSSLQAVSIVSYIYAGIYIFVGLIYTIISIVVFNVFLSFKRILQEGQNGDIEMK